MSTLFNHLFSSVSVDSFTAFTTVPWCMHVHFSACKQAAAHPGSTSERRLLRHQHHTQAYSCDTHQRLTEKRRNCWIKKNKKMQICEDGDVKCNSIMCSVYKHAWVFFTKNAVHARPVVGMSLCSFSRSPCEWDCFDKIVICTQNFSKMKEGKTFPILVHCFHVIVQ